MKTIALIPARGGSTRIPEKNLYLCAGKPLIQWSIEAALASKYIDETFVSTDDKRIAEAALRFGARVIRRPPAFAETLAPIPPVTKHLAEKEHADEYVVLRPTSPIRVNGLVDKAIELFRHKNVDTLVTGFYTTDRAFPHKDIPCQSLPRWFVFDGNVEIQKRHVAIGGKSYGDSFYQMDIPHMYNIEIDNFDDLFVATAVLEKLNGKN